ncbi:4Fe-4S binding protein [Methanococcoides methylutens]|uniref:Dissimilatory sulfite reductase (Desulfoviridin), alpha and beta subunits n=1 Tax=Methanococcoides methylutens MM1 TaxID=1434104 RepID=A0A0E3WZD6_METMT|nr:4Fe-4S binding protein [Methanococcoides methylutens]AKB84730.1 Dissimilatory sulfite reductase (desulfoviridin), alpha and beta subunits [Methanococcoides methylutens MM1]
MGNKTINYDRLKQGGFLRQRQKEDLFSMRLRVVGGQLTADQLRALADASEKYGRGEVHITARQGLEISYVPLDDAEDLLDELEKGDVYQGTCGPRVRGVVACQGNLICPRGLIDAEDIAKKIDEKYFAMELPGKFKFAVTGCPSSCMKPQENDLGVMGGLEPEWVNDKCTYCGLCQTVCPVDAIKVENGALEFYRDKCNLCGQCLLICPTEAWVKSREGYTVYVGGKVGKYPRLGVKLTELVDEDTLFRIIERSVEFFKIEATSGERFGDTIQRVGFEEFKAFVLE